MHIATTLSIERTVSLTKISFSSRDVKRVIPHEDDHMVINLQMHNRNIKKVFVDPNNSTNVLY